MGKKDGKRVDKTKVEAKKAKQVAKQTKLVKKSVKKEIQGLGEDDIEVMIAEFAAKDKERTHVSVSVCPQPSPRSNFSMTALPSGEMLLFGGEYCDGEQTTVYNELFRWNIEKGGGEWRQIESLNIPPPRCSHQAVYFKDKIFVFGGEYATLDQFHHYRDLWSLDLKANTWTEIKATGDVPTARSGHRMLVWRGYIVLFGGFYEALREVRWYNDFYLYSFAEERWTNIPYKAHSQIPKQRSGVQMSINQIDDIIYIYGGYSKEKVAGQKKEGKVHEDMWCLNLKPLLGTAGSSTSGGRVSIDTSKAVWQKITKKGHYPTPRCGAVMTVYKNKGLFFGGVFDDEGPNHCMTSCFYNEMYAFDMGRKKWYQLGLKIPKTKTLKDKNSKIKRENDGDESDEEGDNEVEEGAEEEEDVLDKGNFFGYVDENGNVVYVDMDQDEDEVDNMIVIPNLESSDINNNDSNIINDDINNNSDNNINDSNNINDNVINNNDNNNSNNNDNNNNNNNNKTQINNTTMEVDESTVTLESVSLQLTKMEFKSEPSQNHGKKIDKYKKLPNTEKFNPGTNNLSTYFLDRMEPSPRINPCLMVKGNTLYIYGGMTELGDVEVTLDDCWALDLNKRDTWKRVLQGTMHNLVWKGEDEMDTGTEGSEGSDSDSNSDSDDSDDSDDDDDEEETVDIPTKLPSKSGKASEKMKRRVGGMSSGAIGGLREEMEGLRAHLGVTDENRTPLGGETLRQFYSRTVAYWSSEVIRIWKEDEEKNSNSAFSGEIMSEKEIKKKGFLGAEMRYNELLPILARLTELEKEQEEEEDRRDLKGGKGGKDSGSGKRR